MEAGLAGRFIVSAADALVRLRAAFEPIVNPRQLVVSPALAHPLQNPLANSRQLSAPAPAPPCPCLPARPRLSLGEVNGLGPLGLGLGPLALLGLGPGPLGLLGLGLDLGELAPRLTKPPPLEPGRQPRAPAPPGIGDSVFSVGFGRFLGFRFSPLAPQPPSPPAPSPPAPSRATMEASLA